MGVGNIIGLIEKKRDKKPLNQGEISWLVNQILGKKIPDYQLSALLMAITCHGLDPQETHLLTEAMKLSGEVLPFQTAPEFRREKKLYIDKHSTGGVGDKTSFLLLGIAAAAGVKIPMIAGRGLGHTGGTIDKVESIRGFRSQLPLDQLKRQLKQVGMALTSQTQEIAPVDRVLYALRDVTGTVPSLGLITASIMSKKLAEGTSGLVLDIKYGPGAFMERPASAKLLAQSLMTEAKAAGKTAHCWVTSQHAPLGEWVGNSMEIFESIDLLKNHTPQTLSPLQRELMEVTLELAAGMIHLAGLAPSLASAKKLAVKCWVNREGYKKFLLLVQTQSPHYQNSPKELGRLEFDLKRAPLNWTLKAARSGYVGSYDVKKIGELGVRLGAGRLKAGDSLDLGVAFHFQKALGEKVKKGDVLASVYAPKAKLNLDFQRQFAETIKLQAAPTARPALILKKYSWPS